MACDLTTLVIAAVVFIILATVFPILRRTISYLKFTGPAAIGLIILAWYLLCVA